MVELQKCQDPCPSARQEVSTRSKANRVVSVLNLMIDHSGNIVENEVGPTMGGGDLMSPVVDVRNDNKDCNGHEEDVRDENKSYSGSDSSRPGDCEEPRPGKWWDRVASWLKCDTSFPKCEATASYPRAGSASGKRGNSYGAPSATLKDSAVFSYSAYNRGQRGYGYGVPMY